MTIYELNHLFYRFNEDMVYSPKSLGFFLSYKDIQEEIKYFCTQPGFGDNPDAFSVRELYVSGVVQSNTVYEALVYLHSEDYEFEADIPLGIYGSEEVACEKILRYCEHNTCLVHAKGTVCEKIINRYIIGKRDWLEGFIVEQDDA